MSAVVCKGCGGVLVKTIYGWGHMTNPGYKHHVPTPRSGRHGDGASSPSLAGASAALIGVPETRPSRDTRKVNSRGSVPMGGLAAQETPGTPLRPPSGGVGARGSAPSVPPDASAGRSTA